MKYQRNCLCFGDNSVWNSSWSTGSYGQRGSVPSLRSNFSNSWENNKRQNTNDLISIGAESPEGLGSGPSASRTSDAPNTPYSLFLSVIIIPLAFAFHLYS
ncbi:hypothetical protein F2Q69_00036176 [Brassica cretica]|uniref:Uncharacterized protein n=2 Tax=Brassica cretica TaxID=69181 RepID=A0ABQ7BQF4_BRACR|nr:hypothetical protein DY000_02040700 [Brassica cretica]KAF3603130.1 hypothetical protein F2Q69_00036176 [Brassica cretica]